METRDWLITRGLLNKELRESRLLIIGFVLLSAARHLVQSSAETDHYLAGFLHYAPALLAVLWGAINGDARSRNRLYEHTHLPVSTYHLLLTSYVFPVAFLSVAAVALSDPWEAADLSIMPPMLAAFSFSYFFASISSQRLATVIGAICVACSQAVLPLSLPDAPLLAWSAMAGSGVAVLMSSVLKGIVRADLSRALCVAIAVAALCVPLASEADRIVRHEQPEPFASHTYTAADRTIKVRAVLSDMRDGRSGPSTAEFRDECTSEVHSRVCRAAWHAAWVGDRRFVYLLESGSASRTAAITRWDTKTGRCGVVLRLPLKPDFEKLCKPGHFASADPSTRYMIARLAGIQNSSVDLWLIDLKRGRARVILQNAAYFNPECARWLAGKVLIPSYRSRIIQVDLSTGATVYLSHLGGSR